MRNISVTSLYMARQNFQRVAKNSAAKREAQKRRTFLASSSQRPPASKPTDVTPDQRQNDDGPKMTFGG